MAKDGDLTEPHGDSAWWKKNVPLLLSQKDQPQKPFCLMLTFFYEGGLWFMSILTILLVGIFFAAWKAPRWVKEIGLFALLFGILGTVLGLYQVLIGMRDFAAEQGATSLGSLLPPRVVLGGLKVTLNTTIYGICIYLVSLVVRVIQKPRL
jgi:hypothetical protein